MFMDASITFRPSKAGLLVHLKTCSPFEQWVREQFGEPQVINTGTFYLVGQNGKEIPQAYMNVPLGLNGELFNNFHEEIFETLSLLQLKGTGEGIRLIFPRYIATPEDLTRWANNLAHSVRDFARLLESVR